jgi:CheY-like chemotaxis protein
MVKPLHPKDLTALIVEDSHNDATITARALNTFGIKKCHTVGTAEDALEFLAHHTCDVALIDYRLPGMDGLQLLERIRESYPEILAILVTGVRDEHVAVSAMKLGAVDYVAKDDLLTGDLVRSLQTALRERMASREEERRSVILSGADRIQVASEEARWLVDLASEASHDLTARRFREKWSDVLASDSPPRDSVPSGSVALDYGEEQWPDVLDAFLQYMSESFRAFPAPASKEEDLLVGRFVSRGSSPREVMMVYRAALRSLLSDPASTGAEPPLNPTVLLARILARLVDECQRQSSVIAAGEDTA